MKSQRIRQRLSPFLAFALALAASTAAEAVTVLSSIASDCSDPNAQTQLNTFFAGIPDGTPGSPTVIDFPANGCYQASDRIEVWQKSNVIIDGHGSTFRTSAPNSGCYIKPNWLVYRGQNIRLRNMRIVGNFHPPPGAVLGQGTVGDMTVSCVGNQFNPGIYFSGGTTIHVRNVDIRNVFGDGILMGIAWYIAGQVGDPLETPTDVHIERITVTDAARMAIAPVTVDGLWVEDSHLRDSWYGGIDAELDDGDKQKARNMHFLRNILDGYPLFGFAVPVAGNQPGKPNQTDIIEIRHNIFTDSPGPEAYCNHILSVGIYPTSPNTFSGVEIEYNTFQKRKSTAVQLDHVTSGSVRYNKDIAYEESGCNYPNGPAPFYLATNTSNVLVSDNGPTAPGATLSPSGTGANFDAVTPPADPPPGDPPPADPLSPAPDGGSAVPSDPETGTGPRALADGCGCRASSASLPLGFLVLMLGHILRRRRRFAASELAERSTCPG